MNKYCIHVAVPKVLLGTTICVTFDFMVICPVPTPPKAYGGTLSITYTPRVDEGNVLRVLEWDSFGGWIKTLKLKEMSAEKMAHTVISEFIEAVDPEDATLHMVISTPFHLPAEITLKYKAER